MNKDIIKRRVTELRVVGAGQPVDGVYPLDKFDHDGHRRDMHAAMVAELANCDALAYQDSAFAGVSDDTQVEVQRVVTYRGTAANVKRQLVLSLAPGEARHNSTISIHIAQSEVRRTRGVLAPRGESEALDEATIRWRRDTE